MLPTSIESAQRDFEIVEQPSKVFRLNHESETIAGTINGLEAVEQSIFIILSVERYENLIHSWNFGVELADLYGRPVSFCLPEIKRRVTEALIQDDRITGVDNFEFHVSKGKVQASFHVKTTDGDIESGIEVDV